MKRTLLLLIALSFLACIMPRIEAGSLYTYEGSIGTQISEDENYGKPFDTIPIEHWTEHKLIFLPSQKLSKAPVYQDFIGGTGKDGHPTYEECVGRIGTIIEIIREYSSTHVGYTVTVEMDDNRHIYTGLADIISGTLRGVALLDDLENARKLWLGKLLWLRDGTMFVYSAETKKHDIVSMPRYSPVRVVNIVVGWFSTSPVRFILQTLDGQEGFLDLTLSGTNIGWDLRHIVYQRSFEHFFLEENPYEKYNWDPEIWAAIEAWQLLIGMTKEQVVMSWGTPTQINTTLTEAVKQEQWIYNDKLDEVYLCFENGILISIKS